MGRVGRMPGTGLPKGERRRRKRGEGKATKRINQGNRFIIYVWSGLLCSLAVLGLGIAIWFGLSSKKNAGQATPIVFDESAQQPVMPTKVAAPSDAESIEIVRKALSLRDPAQLTEYFRLGDNSAEDVSAFLTASETRDGALGSIDWIGSMDANNLQIEGVLVNYVGEKPRNRVALLTPGEGAKWKIDFDAFARTVRPSLKDLLDGRAKVSVARVYLAVETYYNGPYADDSKWACYGLASPDEETVLLGYCERGSPQEAALRWMLSKGSSMTRATLELRPGEGGLARQFLITKVVAEDWLVGDKAFDEGFE